LASKPGQSFEQQVESAIIATLETRDLTTSERIKTLNVAVRFAAVKKGLNPDAGAGFDLEEG
jgi:hypothetical protein